MAYSLPSVAERACATALFTMDVTLGWASSDTAT